MRSLEVGRLLELKVIAGSNGTALAILVPEKQHVILAEVNAEYLRLASAPVETDYEITNPVHKERGVENP